MKTAVIYTSQTGFTKQYARWISQEADADCFELEEAKKQDLECYEAIVFGGWACAGTIHKLSWFKSNAERWKDKTLIVFCTGGCPADSPEIQTFINNNFNENERKYIDVFYCPGGFRYEKMTGKYKVMMKLFSKMMAKKKNKTEAEEEMARMISHSYDISDRKYIEPVIECLTKERNGFAGINLPGKKTSR